MGGIVGALLLIGVLVALACRPKQQPSPVEPVQPTNSSQHVDNYSEIRLGPMQTESDYAVGALVDIETSARGIQVRDTGVSTNYAAVL